MSITLAIMDDVLSRLKNDFTDLSVEYFPESPNTYRLNHPKGALLLSYGKSSFGKPMDIGAVVQSRDVTLRVTLIYRQLNQRDGAISILDRMRQSLLGYQPVHCRRRIYAVNEVFIGNVDSLWNYALDIATETIQIQQEDNS